MKDRAVVVTAVYQLQNMGDRDRRAPAVQLEPDNAHGGFDLDMRVRGYFVSGADGSGGNGEKLD